jgi:outer membrane protein OmpA-like peptidoglycan-associated protein
MSLYKKLLSLAAISLVLVIMQVPSASAMSSKDVVRSTMGDIVHDSFGDCVRTIWDADSDLCSGAVDIMKMEERIIYFDFDKFDLKMSEKEKLDKLSGVLKDQNIKKVKIVGFTDIIGSHDYNLKLSEKRAMSVKKYLDGKVEFDSSPIDLRGMGEANQVKVCDGIKGKKVIECLAPNRRVEVEIDYFDTIR